MTAKHLGYSLWDLEDMGGIEVLLMIHTGLPVSPLSTLHPLMLSFPSCSLVVTAVMGTPLVGYTVSGVGARVF